MLAGCNSNRTSLEDYNTKDVTLPGGQVIQAQLMVRTVEMMNGMAFRTSIAPDHGMLFVHEAPGHYSYWMYQHLIPLDMIWMDDTHKIVEIVENAPPCKTVASQCPHYGGNKEAHYVLEMGAGMVKKYGLKIGDAVQW